MSLIGDTKPAKILLKNVAKKEGNSIPRTGCHSSNDCFDSTVHRLNTHRAHTYLNCHRFIMCYPSLRSIETVFLVFVQVLQSSPELTSIPNVNTDRKHLTYCFFLFVY